MNEMTGLAKYHTPQEGTIDYGYGPRNDGTLKGPGWFGELPMQDGSKDFMTEKSYSYSYGDGINHEVPILNPLLTKTEIDYLLKGGEPTEAMHNKASEWGFTRLQQGKSPFIQPDEQPLVHNKEHNYGLLNYRGK